MIDRRNDSAAGELSAGRRAFAAKFERRPKSMKNGMPRPTAMMIAIVATACLGGCNRASGENAAAANMSGNQAPNAMGDAALPPTGNTDAFNNSASNISTNGAAGGNMSGRP
jgi:hypothetical protein